MSRAPRVRFSFSRRAERLAKIRARTFLRLNGRWCVASLPDLQAIQGACYWRSLDASLTDQQRATMKDAARRLKMVIWGLLPPPNAGGDMGPG